MELHDYLRVLRKRWLSILALTVLALGGAAAATLLTTPQYQATTQVYVKTSDTGTTSALQQGGSFAQSVVATYATVTRTAVVLGPVVQRLGLGTTSQQLAERVTAEAPLDQTLVNITVTDPSPRRSATIANAVAASLRTWVETTQGQGATGATPSVIASVTQPAVVPGAPSSPNTRLNLALGLLVGLAVGVGFAVLRDALDTRVRGESDLVALGLPLLAGMPYDEQAQGHPLVVVDEPRSVRAETFRQLRTNLQFATAANGAKSVVVTSAVEGEGKSTTAINLAITLASAGSRVALLDGDLRRPTVATYLGLEGAVGLTTVLVGRAALADVLQPWGPSGKLSVLPAGEVPPNPSELLASEGMTKMLRELEESHDVVLIDGAPLLPVTDSAVLAEGAGGALIVVAAGRTKRPILKRALASLHAVDATVLGAVVTMLPTKGADAYSTYSYSYRHHAAQQSEQRAG